MIPMHEISNQDLESFKDSSEVAFPAQLKVAETELVCTDLLRLLAGKRMVCTGQYKGQRVLLKLFFGASYKRRWARELDGVTLIKQADIKTPEVITSHCDDGSGIGYIVFEFIDNAKTLDTRLNEAKTPDERMRVFQQALTLIAQMHSADIYQKDVHLDNFLDNGSELYLIDGDQLILEKGSNGLSEKRVIENLAMFFTQLFQWEHEYIEAFITSYVALRKKAFPPNFLSSITQQLADYKQWREKKYIEKKVFRSCSAFDVIKNWNTFCVFSCDFSKNNALNIIKNIDALIDKGEILKSGRTATVARIDLCDEVYIVKRYNRKNWFHFIVRSLLESRAAVSWRNGHLLSFNSIATAKPLLILENRWGILRGRSYVVTEYIKGTHAFDYFNQSNEVEKNALSEKISYLVSHLHQCGFSHGDLKPQNIWVAEEQPIFIDLDGMKKVRRGNEDNFLKDWERLNKSIKGNVGIVPYIRRYGEEEVLNSISIIIPTYNYSDQLVVAVESVVGQMNAIDELIIVDDGSTDNTQSILKVLGTKHQNKLKIFIQENTGAAAARNNGVRKSSGNYLVFLDADDELEAGALEKYREAVKSDSDAELFLAGHTSIEESGYKKEHLVSFLSKKKEVNVKAYWDKKIPMCHGAFLVRKTALNNIFYPENLRSGEDISVFTHLLARCKTSLIKGTVLRVNKHIDSLRNVGLKDKKTVHYLVESVFNSDFLTPSLMGYKKDFLVNRMLSLSRDKFLSACIVEGRSAYRQAICEQPSALFKWSYFGKYIRSFFGKKV